MVERQAFSLGVPLPRVNDALLRRIQKFRLGAPVDLAAKAGSIGRLEVAA